MTMFTMQRYSFQQLRLIAIHAASGGGGGMAIKQQCILIYHVYFIPIYFNKYDRSIKYRHIRKESII